MFYAKKLVNQIQDNSFSGRLPDSIAVSKTGPQWYPDHKHHCKYNQNNHHENYHGIEAFFKDYTKHEINEVCTDLAAEIFVSFVSDIRRQKQLISAEPLTREFIFSDNVAANVFTDDTPVLTSKIVRITSDVQKVFDFLSFTTSPDRVLFLISKMLFLWRQMLEIKKKLKQNVTDCLGLLWFTNSRD